MNIHTDIREYEYKQHKKNFQTMKKKKKKKGH